MSAAANMIYVLLLQIITTIIINPFFFDLLFNSLHFDGHIFSLTFTQKNTILSSRYWLVLKTDVDIYWFD